MAKLTFPAAAKPYQGILSAMRQPLTAWARIVQREPQARPAMIAQIGALVNKGVSTIIVNGKALTGVAPTGVYATTVTFTVANGAITAIVLS